jgi:hypothetical protein
MDRPERTEFFERLVALRDGYPGDGDDRGSALSIDDAVRYVHAILTAIETDAEPWIPEPDHAFVDGAGDEPGLPPPGPRFASDLWPRPTRRSRTTARQDDVEGV